MPDFQANHSTANNDDDIPSLLSFRNCSLMLGYTCGVFVHLSSLAANYFLMFQDQHHAEGMKLEYDDNQVLWTNLIWSLAISFIAFSVLGITRNTLGLDETRLVQLDSLFSTGVLGGLCSSWFCTDVFLGFRMHLRTSCLLFVVAALCLKGLATMEAGCRKTQQSKLIAPSGEMLEPLLAEDKDENLGDGSESDDARFRRMGLRCGVLIGVLIQLSGLGEDTLIYHNDEVEDDGNRWLMVSLVWSFVISGLGILALFFIRQLLLLSLPGISVKNLVTVECFFAAGATSGLNLAWAATDVFLGLEPHFAGATITTIVSFGWCKLILYYSNKDIRLCGDKRNWKENGHHVTKYSGIV